MMRLGKFSTAAALGLIISLALFTTSVFAQSASQSVDRGNISVSAHAAVENTAAQGTARVLLGKALLRPNGVRNNCGNWGWGNGCDGCSSWHNCFNTHEIFRCASEKICKSVKICHWSRWGRVCRGEHICRMRSICRRCFEHFGDGRGRFSSWAVKR